MNSRETEFSQIQDGWLHIRDAMYLFAPNYLNDDQKRKNALRSEAASFFASERIQAKYEARGAEFGASFLGLKFKLDDRHVFYAQEDTGVDFDSDDWRMPSFMAYGDSFDEFRANLLKPAYGRPHERAAAICNKLAYELMRMYRDGFDQAIRTETALVYARARSTLNNFTRIFPDQWRHFRVVDIEAGTAEGPTGERLFSCHVLPSEPPAIAGQLAAVATSGARNPSKSAAIRECTAWLVSLLQASPDRRTHSMAELEDEARTRWPVRLSGRGFITAYGDARNAVTATAWGKTGPRSRVGN